MIHLQEHVYMQFTNQQYTRAIRIMKQPITFVNDSKHLFKYLTICPGTVDLLF